MKSELHERADDIALGLLLRLNPKTQSITVRVDGEKTLVSPADIAACLSGLPSVSLWIAKAIVLGDMGAVQFLQTWMLSVAIRLSHDRQWDISHEQKELLAEIVHKEVVRGRCLTCRGRGLAPDTSTHKLAPCLECCGLGFHRMTIDQKAELFGVKRRMYFLRWRHKEAEIHSHYNSYENKVLDRIKEQFHIPC